MKSMFNTDAPTFWTKAEDGTPYLWTSREMANLAAKALKAGGLRIKVEKMDEPYAYAIVNALDEDLYVSQEALGSDEITFNFDLLTPAASEQDEQEALEAETKWRTRMAERKARPVPIAPPVTLLAPDNFNFRKPYNANPETDAARFETACREADALAKKTGYDTLVFKAPHGFYFTRESKFCRVDIANGAMTSLYEAKAGPKTYDSTVLGRVTIPED